MDVIRFERYRWIAKLPLSKTARFVLVVLVHHTIDGKRINCTKKEITDLHKISLRTLNSCLQELKAHEALVLKPDIPFDSPWLNAILLPQHLQEVRYG